MPLYAQAQQCATSPCTGEQIYTPGAGGLKTDWSFKDNSSLNASAPNAVSGGRQQFDHASSLNAKAADAVSGGNQFFNDSSSLNVSEAGTVSGGNQYFNHTSRLNASKANAISGGNQHFIKTSVLNAETGDAISNGKQQFADNSSLHASAEKAVNGGTQYLNDNAAIEVQAENALSKGAEIHFRGTSTGLAPGNNQLRLNGYSTTIGAIHSVNTGPTASAGIIVNNGSTAAVLTVDSSERGDSAFSGVMQDGSGVLGLAKAGAGALTLFSNNSYSGGTTIDAGTLVLSAAGRLNASGAVDLAATGASFDIAAADGARTIGALSGVAGTSVVLGDNSLTFGSAEDKSFAGSITGTAGLIKQGSGTQTLLGSNSYSGNTTIKGGTLSVASDANLGSGAVTLDGGVLQVTGKAFTGFSSQAFGLGASGGGVDIADAANNFTVGDMWSGAGGLIKQGAGTLTLTGSNSYGGGTTIDAGTLALSGAGSLNASGAVDLAAADASFDIAAADNARTIGALSGVASTSVVLGANSLTFGDGADKSFAGSITGTAGLIKQGTGTQTLSGSSNYGGDTQINEGQLLFSGQLTHALGGNLTVASNAQLGIGESAAVQVAQAVTLNDNATLSISSNAINPSLRAQSLRIDPAAVFNLSGVYSPSAKDWVLIDTAQGITGDFVTPNTGGFTGVVDYLALAARKSDDGRQYLASYQLNWFNRDPDKAHGTFTLSEASNQFEVGTALTDQAPSNNSWNGTTLTKAGNGTLILLADNEYSGGTQIQGGTLQLGKEGGSSGTLGSGDVSVASGATLALERSDAWELANVLSGSGALVQRGAGTTTLTGDSSAFSGNTLVQAGTLALAGSGKLGGSLRVASGATLAGSGTLGNATIASGGVIAPGSTLAGVHTVGTLKVLGDLNFENGAVYQVHADPTSHASDRIEVSGKATLAGAVMHVGPQSGFEVGKSYSILLADSLSGQFASATSNYAYLDTRLQYSPSEVLLQLQRKSSDGGGDGDGGDGGGMSFADLATTANQIAVAHSLDSLPSSHALYRFVETLPAGAPAAVFDQLSGDSHANVQRSLPGQAGIAAHVSLQQLRSNMTAGMRAGAAIAQSEGTLPASAWPSSKALPAWAQVVGHWQTQNSDGNSARSTQHTGGLFIGGDQELASGWRLGGSVGYTRADGKVRERSASSTTDSYSAAVYGGKSFAHGAAHLNLLGGLAYTWHDIATERHVASLNQTLKADYGAHTTQLFAELGYALGQYDKSGIEPFVGISVGEQRVQGFEETGGLAALRGQGKRDSMTSSTLGVRAHSDFKLGRMEGRMRASLGWRHAFGDVQVQKTMAFEGAQNFTVAGAPLARNTALIGLQAELQLSRSAAVVLGYQGEYSMGGSSSRDHAATVKLRWAF